MSTKTPYAAGMFCLDFGNGAVGHCPSVSGGHYKAELATQKTSIGYERKNIAGLTLEPIKAEVGLGMAKDLIAWMQAYTKGEALLKSGIFHACDYSGKSRAIREFMDAQITELSFPALDAGSKDMGKISMTLVPRQCKDAPGTGANVGGNLAKAQKLVSLQSFMCEIGGLPCDNVVKIDAVKCETKKADVKVGKFREYGIAPTSKSVSNVKLTINMEDYDEWYKAFKRFVIDGECSEDDEMTGSITYLAQNQKTELMRLDLKHMGFISMERQKLEAGKDAIDQFVVEMYIEMVEFDAKAVA